MKFKASQIAELLDGKIEGNQDAEVDKLSKIEEGEGWFVNFSCQPQIHLLHLFD